MGRVRLPWGGTEVGGASAPEAARPRRGPRRRSARGLSPLSRGGGGGDRVRLSSAPKLWTPRGGPGKKGVRPAPGGGRRGLGGKAAPPQSVSAGVKKNGWGPLPRLNPGGGHRVARPSPKLARGAPMLVSSRGWAPPGERPKQKLAPAPLGVALSGKGLQNSLDKKFSFARLNPKNQQGPQLRPSLPQIGETLKMGFFNEGFLCVTISSYGE